MSAARDLPRLRAGRRIGALALAALIAAWAAPAPVYSASTGPQTDPQVTSWLDPGSDIPGADHALDGDLLHLAQLPAPADSPDAARRSGAPDAPGEKGPGSTGNLPPGQRRPGLAVGEVVGLNVLIYAWDTAVRRDRNFGVSPQSIWRNLRSARFDGSYLEVNQVGHPYHGGLLFNAGRANGYGFYASAGIAVAGTYMWECCLEVEPPSINDLVFTSIGGIAMGESAHRLGALVFRPGASGLEGLGRGLLGFVVDPMGGFTRLATGRTASWGRPYEGTGNVHLDAFLGIGGRVQVADPYGDATSSRPSVDLRISYGAVPKDGPEKPYDAFEMRARVEPGRLPLRRLAVDGVLASWPLGNGRGSTVSRLRLRQRLDFLRDAGLGYGSTSLTLGPRVSLRLGDASALEAFAAGEWAILTAFEAGREGGSKSDYGPGIGARAGAVLLLGGHERLRVDHSVTWTHTMRGLSTSNRLQLLEARASVLRLGPMALALDLTAVRRLGHMVEGPDVRAGSTSLRVFAAMDVGGQVPSEDWR